MKHNILKSFLALSTILFANCETVVDVNIELEKPMVVVNAIFNPDSTWRVDVSLTRHILSDHSDRFPVRNAKVSIIDPVTNELIEELSHTNRYDGQVYEGVLLPEKIKEYKVRVEVPGNTPVEAIDRTPQAVPLTKVDFDESKLQNTTEPIPVKIYFTDPPSSENFYSLSVVQKSYNINYTTGDTIWYSYKISMEFDDPALLGNDEFTSELFFTDRLFNGKDQSISFKLQPYFSNVEHVSIYFNSISQSYYEYMTTSKLQREVSGDPFAQPVQVFSNIENGLGIFAAYSLDEWKLKKNP